MKDLLDYLQSRRSALALTLNHPAPDAGQIRTMIKIASRVPDHGKLAPWRFVEYPRTIREELAAEFRQLSDQKPDTKTRQSRNKQIENFQNAPLVIGAISCPVESPKVPEWEQILSAGATCMQLLMAANALGFEAQWLSGFYMFDKKASKLLGLLETEKLAGMIHIGSSDVAKNERARPELVDIFSVFAKQE